MPHHLYDLLPMDVVDFNVQKYTCMAVDVIRDVCARGKLPVVVGGTNYYIEGLLFDKEY